VENSSKESVAVHVPEGTARTGHGPVSLADVFEARRTIAPHLRPTPLYEHHGLSALVGASVHVKHENHLPTGAFKVRGGVNLVGQLDQRTRDRGLVAASTGNHGQSVAYAARLFGARATICVPEHANPGKVAAIRALGAHVVERGRDFDDAREHCEQLARSEGLRYVHSGNEPLLIAGVATHTLEIVEEQPAVEVVLVPIGGGSGAAGACIAAKAIDPSIEVIGVQAAAAPAAYRSWKSRELVTDEMNTHAEGLATRVPFELPQSILWEHLDDFVLVSEAELEAATRLMIEHTHNLVEAAAASPLAAALNLRDRLRGRTVALICSGGNITPSQLATLFSSRATV
jgi:threonine dehydratase